MKLKKGFTLVELIAVIVILALLLVLLIPNITNVSKNSKETLRESKLRTIVTAGEEYGNDDINTYSGCVYGVSSNNLAKNCTVTLSRLVKMGYIEGEDDDDNIIDPVSNEAFGGKILLCYNPSEVNVYSYYVEDENYSCKEINTNTDNTLNLSAINGIGYVGGKDVEANLIPNGNFTRFTCKVSDSKYAACSIVNGKKLVITPTQNRTLVINDYIEVSIVVTGYYNDKFGENSEMHKEYILKLFPTSMEIENDTEICMASGTTKDYLMLGQNMGKITVTSNNPSILEGTSKDDYLYLSAGNTTGEVTLTIKENNGNNSTSLSKKVYKLDVGEIPQAMILHNVVEVPIAHSGAGEVTVTSDNPKVAQFSLDGVNFKDSITLTGQETKFYFIAISAGIGTVTVQGSTCGKVEQSFSSTNLTLSEHNSIVYIGGHSVTVDLESPVVQNYTCESENTAAATCEIHGSTIEIIPGTKPVDEVLFHIRGSKGGYDVLKVQVLKTSIELINDSGEEVDNVCISTDPNETDTKVIARGTNMGRVTIYDIEDWYLAEATIADNIITLTKRQISESDAQGLYKSGFNTGITAIDVKESNGNVMDTIDYHIYSMNLSSKTGTMIVDESIEFTVDYSATGTISVSSSNESIAKAEIVEVIDNESDSEPNINVYNKAKIRVTGVGTGTAIITVRGADCGVETYTISVEGKTFSITLTPGDNTSSLEKTFLSCQTEGTSRSCNVVFPNIYASGEFKAVGYSKKKNDTSYEYLPGDTIELTEKNTGTVFYGNSKDAVNPTCTFVDFSSNAKIGEKSYITVNCTDGGSGINGSDILKKSDFYTSNENIAGIVEVSSPTSIENGYSYRIGIENKKVGAYDISLKENSITDKSGNGNIEVSISGILVAEYETDIYWYIGKNTRTDVVAVLYDNEDYKGLADGTYTLAIYGMNDMLDFTYSTSSGGNWRYAPWYTDYREKITDVIIEDTVTNVGDYAFYDATNLKNVTLSKTSTYIGQYAFRNAGLEEITIPASVTMINEYAFYKGTSDVCLANIVIENGSLLNMIGASAFYNHCAASINIPSNTEVIGAYAFYQKNNNKTPAELKTTSLTFDENSRLKTIGADAFCNNRITTLEIPASVEEIGAAAFKNNRNYYDSYGNYKSVAGSLTGLTFEADSNLTTIGQDAFYAQVLTSLSIPASVKTIGKSAFYVNPISTLSFSKDSVLQSIGALAFSGCKVSSLSLPASVKTIGRSAFSGNPISTLSFSKDSVLQSIGASAFSGCKVSSLSLPDSVTSIGGWAFGSSSYISTLNIGPNVDTIGTRILSGQNFTTVTVDENNLHFAAKNGVLYDIDYTNLVLCPDRYGSRYGSLVIPDTVKSITDSAFSGWMWYGGYSFSIQFPSGIENINYDNNYSSFTISSFTLTGNENYITKDGILYSKDLLTLYKAPSAYFSSSYTINDGTTTIYESAFNGQVNIRSLTVPASVKTIGRYAFSTDTLIQGLQSIYLYSDENLSFYKSSFGLGYVGSNYERSMSRYIYVYNEALQQELVDVMTNNQSDYEKTYYTYNIILNS